MFTIDDIISEIRLITEAGSCFSRQTLGREIFRIGGEKEFYSGNEMKRIIKRIKEKFDI